MINFAVGKNGFGLNILKTFEITIFTVTDEDVTHLCLDLFLWKIGFSQQLTLGEVNLCHAVREAKKN
jgi:hypothetical protein